MFDNLLNKRVKVVWRDGDLNKSTKGKLTSSNEVLINVLSDDNCNIFISIRDIVSAIELRDD